MFETSTVRATAATAERRAGLLTVSVAVHSAVILAAIVAGISSIRFPTNAPNKIERLIPTMPVQIPPPLGRPDAPHHAAPVPPPAQRPAAPVNQVTAPPTVPDHVTPLTNASTGDNSSSAVATTDTGGPGWGSPNGDPHGIDLGQPEAPASPATPAGPLTPGIGDVHAARVLTRVDPVYPRIAIGHRISGVVKLKCVIDRSGRISNPEVVFSSFPAFDQPALAALQQWTFSPGSLRGQPVDTYFELTITFQAR